MHKELIRVAPAEELKEHKTIIVRQFLEGQNPLTGIYMLSCRNYIYIVLIVNYIIVREPEHCTTCLNK